MNRQYSDHSDYLDEDSKEYRRERFAKRKRRRNELAKEIEHYTPTTQELLDELVNEDENED